MCKITACLSLSFSWHFKGSFALLCPFRSRARSLPFDQACVRGEERVFDQQYDPEREF